MNLFIGLLNMAIENYNKHEEFLLLKARVFYYFDITSKMFDFIKIQNPNYGLIIRLLWKSNYFT